MSATQCQEIHYDIHFNIPFMRKYSRDSEERWAHLVLARVTTLGLGYKDIFLRLWLMWVLCFKYVVNFYRTVLGSIFRFLDRVKFRRQHGYP